MAGGGGHCHPPGGRSCLASGSPGTGMVVSRGLRFLGHCELDNHCQYRAWSVDLSKWASYSIVTKGKLGKLLLFYVVTD